MSVSDEDSRRWSMCRFQYRPMPTLTTYDSGPVFLMTFPGTHFWVFGWKSQTITCWPISNDRALVCWLCCVLWVSCLVRTSAARSGCSSVRRVRHSRLSMRVAGVRLVVAWGVERYVRRKSANLCDSDRPSFSLALSDCFSVWLKHSTSPFEAGWYGALRMCLILFRLQKSSDVNCGPLSETIYSGIPCVEKSFRRLVMVLPVYSCVFHFKDFGPFRIWVYHHQEGRALEWASKIYVDSLPRLG